ncbi:MAG: BON domain-containing protein [Desulfovibrionaceae bacterium]|nr:BON domain-containing protein [Desulfovibrionaceae bacterium]
MRHLHPFILVLALLGLMLQASGCTVYNVAVEERSVGTYVDDEAITFTIKKEFLADDTVKYLDYDAASYEGHVYIVGEYENRTQVDRAVAIAKGVKGVRTVTTYLLPKNDSDHCGTTDNLEIYGRIKKDLVADGDIWSTNVQIKTVQCNVVLLGIVGSMNEREKIIDYAKKTKGVRSVKSYLKIKR